MREPSNDNRTSVFSHPGDLIKHGEFSLQNLNWLRDELEKREITVLSPEECEKNRIKTLKHHPKDQNLWIFAYGSLMWDPAIRTVETVPVTITGWRRSFCIDMMFGQGTPRQPGLMLALDKGGTCRGLAHCIAAEDIESETPGLWQREMTIRAYRPLWVEGDINGKIGKILVFVIDQDTHLYAGSLEPSIQARRIALAEGLLGKNRDYLYHCAEELKRREITDDYIEDLAARTRALAQDLR